MSIGMQRYIHIHTYISTWKCVRLMCRCQGWYQQVEQLHRKQCSWGCTTPTHITCVYSGVCTNMASLLIAEPNNSRFASARLLVNCCSKQNFHYDLTAVTLWGMRELVLGDKVVAECSAGRKCWIPLTGIKCYHWKPRFTADCDTPKLSTTMTKISAHI